MTMLLKSAAALGAILAFAGCQKVEDKAFDARVHAYLLEHPEVLQEMIAKLEQKEQVTQARDAATAIGRHRAQLERDPRDFVANPAGRITVVEFFDYNCGYCKLSAPQVVKLIQENPDVRFVFKEFAFQTPHSVAAARIALTPAGKARGLDLYREFMAQKPLNPDTIDRSLQTVGLDPATARRASADPAIERQLVDVRALTTALGIDGTPAFIVGDQIIHGADIPALRVAIAEAKAKAGRATGPRVAATDGPA
jgi:protein-disulfide isomerase